MTVGAFDNWVHDEQERAMRNKWEEYLENHDKESDGTPPLTFEEFCADFNDKYDPTE